MNVAGKPVVRRPSFKRKGATEQPGTDRKRFSLPFTLSLQMKILGGFIAVIVLLGASLMFTMQALRGSLADSDVLYNEHVQGLANLFPAQASVLMSSQKAMDALLVKDDEEERTFLMEESATQLSEARTVLEEYKASLSNENQVAQVDLILGKLNELQALRSKVFAALRQGNTDLAIQINERGADGAPAADAMAEEIAQQFKLLINSKVADTETIYLEGDKAGTSAMKFAIILGIIAAIAGVGIGLFISRFVRKNVNNVVVRLEGVGNDARELQEGIRAVKDGDLTRDVTMSTMPIANPGRDEIGRASQAINGLISEFASTAESYREMRGGLRDMAEGLQTKSQEILRSSTQLREASDQMAGATGSIASAINDVTRSAVALSSLSQESVGEIERVAAGSQQLAAQASTSATSASDSKSEAQLIGERISLVSNASLSVADAAGRSKQAAAEGKQAVGEAIASMDDIATAVERASATIDRLGEYGEQIGAIVKVIDEIAGQTNLLALNAAIEAARAGEQGRGFAVVADSVRALAERSSASTKEIAQLINRVQEGTNEAVEAMQLGVRDVERGRDVTNRAGSALDSILDTVQVSADDMRRIANDVQDLSTAAMRIITAAETLATMADQSAGGAKEMAEGTSKVTEAILQVSATSEQTSASAEEVSATTEELSAQSEELAATANEMRELALALEQSAARFRLA